VVRAELARERQAMLGVVDRDDSRRGGGPHHLHLELAGCDETAGLHPPRH